MSTNPYATMVSGYAKAFREGKTFPNGGYDRPPRPAISESAPRALIFSPHPDDECIIGGLALRLLKEAGIRVINVAVTQGSNRDRQEARLEELRAACDYMGFGLVQIGDRGLEGVNDQRRTNDPDSWANDVETIWQILSAQQPAVIFVPHLTDWNSTHIGVHWLVMDALAKAPSDFRTCVIETEYWGAMANPNLMVASSEEDVTEMVTGTSFHIGEVTRNPFHLLHPAWMQDNVRRGSELVGGQGEAAPDYSFATLYRASYWENQQLQPAWEGGRNLGLTDHPAELLNLKS